MRTVHVGLPDRTQSQYYEDQLHTLWQQGAIRQDAVYWIVGMPEWRPIGEFFPGLSVQYPANTPTNGPVTHAMQSAYQAATGEQSPYAPQPYYQAPTTTQPVWQPPNYQQPNYGAPSPGPYSIQASPQRPLSLFVKDPTNLTMTLKVLLGTNMGINGVLLLLATARLMMGAGYSTANQPYALLQESLFTLLTSLIAITGFVVWFVTAVHFCKWIHRANTNLRGFGAHGLQFTAGWAVGYLFIPIVNFFRPYQAMSEIWNASRSPQQWQAKPVSNAVGVWWLLFLFWIFGVLVAAYLTQSGQTLDDQHTAVIATIIEYGLAILSAVAAMNLVTKIYQFQYEFVSQQS
jgi:hypothetical protein